MSLKISLFCQFYGINIWIDDLTRSLLKFADLSTQTVSVGGGTWALVTNTSPVPIPIPGHIFAHRCHSLVLVCVIGSKSRKQICLFGQIDVKGIMFTRISP